MRQFGLELDVEAEPIAGRLSCDQGEPRGFTGYVQLISLLERARGAAGGNGVGGER